MNYRLKCALQALLQLHHGVGHFSSAVSYKFAGRAEIIKTGLHGCAFPLPAHKLVKASADRLSRIPSALPQLHRNTRRLRARRPYPYRALDLPANSFPSRARVRPGVYLLRGPSSPLDQVLDLPLRRRNTMRLVRKNAPSHPYLAPSCPPSSFTPTSPSNNRCYLSDALLLDALHRKDVLAGGRQLHSSD